MFHAADVGEGKGCSLNFPDVLGARPVVLVDPFQFRFPGVGIRHETRRRAVLELLFRP